MPKSKAKNRKRPAAVAGAAPCSAARLTFKTLSSQAAFESDKGGIMVFDPTDHWARMYFLTAEEARQLAAWLQRELPPNIGITNKSV